MKVVEKDEETILGYGKMWEKMWIIFGMIRGKVGMDSFDSAHVEHILDSFISWWIPIPRLLASLQMVDHHLEVIEDRDAKLSRLRALIQVYHLIQEKQIVPGCFV